MNFRKTSEWGGGSFPIRKIMLRFFGKGKALRAPISRTKAQHFFPKIGWGGSEAVWKFSENSSNLVQVMLPYFLSCSSLTHYHSFSIADIFIYFSVMLLIIHHFHIDDWLWHCHYFWSIIISFCGLVIFNGSQFFSGRVHPWFLGGSTIAQYKYQYIWLVNDKWGSSKCNPV